MTSLNAFLRALFDLALAPFEGLPPIVGLVVVSLVTGVAMLLVFKKTSDQKRIEAVKRQIHACLFEIRLFNDDLRAIMRAQSEILRRNLTYLRLSLVPMLWMIVPMVLAIAQLQFHYGYGGLDGESPTVIKVTMRQDWTGTPAGVAKPGIELAAPAAIRVETAGLWIPSRREMDWRIAAVEKGDHELAITVDGNKYSKTVRVTQAVVRRSPVRHSGGFLDQLLYPAESPLPADSPIESITVNYPERDVSVFGRDVHWMVVFFVLSIVFAFLLRKPFGVTL